MPPHGSGGGSVARRNDPDETQGRALYRAFAETEARRSLAQGRKVRLMSEGTSPAPAGEEWEVVGGVGFRKTYTEEEWAVIERLREEMRRRLTAPEPPPVSEGEP